MKWLDRRSGKDNSRVHEGIKRSNRDEGKDQSGGTRCHYDVNDKMGSDDDIQICGRKRRTHCIRTTKGPKMQHASSTVRGTSLV